MPASNGRDAPDALGADGVEISDLSGGIYAYTQHDGSWWVNTAGFLVGPDHVLAVDTCATERRTRDLLAAISRISGDLPVRTLVNTHEHGDHTYGNELFGAATIVSHTLCREAMARAPAPHALPPLWQPMPEWGAINVRLPDVTFTQNLTIWVGDVLVELHHPGHPAHTRGDTIVWLPERRVLFTGDLVFQSATPLAAFGSITGMLRALQWLRSFDPITLVPGHGVPCGPEMLQVQERYYRLVLETARAGTARGLTPRQAAREVDLGEFDALPDRERIVMNLHRAYLDLGVGHESTPDVVAGDAIAFNGGRRLHCIA